MRLSAHPSPYVLACCPSYADVVDMLHTHINTSTVGLMSGSSLAWATLRARRHVNNISVRMSRMVYAFISANHQVCLGCDGRSSVNACDCMHRSMSADYRYYE
jgi:hypothetical protein